VYSELVVQLSRHFHNVAALEILAWPTASRFETSTNATVIGSKTHDGRPAETMIESNSSGDVARLCSNAQRTECGRKRILYELDRTAMGTRSQLYT